MLKLKKKSCFFLEFRNFNYYARGIVPSQLHLVTFILSPVAWFCMHTVGASLEPEKKL